MITSRHHRWHRREQKDGGLGEAVTRKCLRNREVTAKTKREIFGEFVCLKPPLRLDSNILEEKTRDKSKERCSKWNGLHAVNDGGRDEGRKQVRKGDGEGMLGSAEAEGEREREKERWRGKALKQKWWHAVISTGLKACQDLTLRVQFSMSHCCLSEAVLESQTNTELKTQIFYGLLEWDLQNDEVPQPHQARRAWLKHNVFLF